MVKSPWYLSLTTGIRAGGKDVAEIRHCGKPQPCGFFNDPTRDCKCSPIQIQRYISKISGPLLDRIDIHLDVPAVRFKELASETPTESSAEIRERVVRARRVQLERFHGENIFCNAQMNPRLIRKYCVVDSASKAL